MKSLNGRSRLTTFVVATGAVILEAGVAFAGEATVVLSHATGSAVATVFASTRVGSNSARTASFMSPRGDSQFRPRSVRRPDSVGCARLAAADLANTPAALLAHASQGSTPVVT